MNSLKCLTVILFGLASVVWSVPVDQTNNMTSENNQTFMYFAYGSNLLLKRIHINNPSAIRKDIGKIQNYRLDFNLFSPNWRGSGATIVEDSNSTVWGAIYEIDILNLKDLDRQEGVPNVYIPITVNVETSTNGIVACRTYTHVENPSSQSSPSNLPDERKPSLSYLQTIIEGAMECKLPDEYIAKLKSISHNGNQATEHILKNLNLRNQTLVFGNALTE